MNETQRRRVLVIEDEMTIALMIEDMLDELGHEVVGVAMRLEPGLRLAQSAAADLAILDVNLDGKPSFPIADILADRGVAFMFATGYGAQGVDEAYREAITLQKPFQLADLAKAINRACNAGVA